MSFDLNSILLLIVVFQFLFMGVFLLTNWKGKRTSNVLLGMLCITISINLLEMLITMNGHYNIVILFSFMDLVLMLLYGPLILLYSKSVIYKGFSLSFRDLFHFIPFLLFAVLVFINYQNTTEEQKLAAIEKIYTYNLSFSQAMVVVPFYLHIIIYIFWTFRQIQIYQRVISEDFSDLNPYSINWLSFLIKSFLAITIISLFLSISPYTELRHMTSYALAVDIILTFFIINTIVFKALKQPELFSGIETPKKYDKSNLTGEDKDSGLKAIEQLMNQDKPYLDPELSLNSLARSLGMRDREVSQIINERIQLSFHDYINDLRIDYAKDLMVNNKDEKLTVLEILYQSGYNSKSSFNSAFKKRTGQTPTEFRKSLINN